MGHGSWVIISEQIDLSRNTCSLEVTSSNPGRDTSYPDIVVSIGPSKKMAASSSDYATTISFHILSSSLCVEMLVASLNKPQILDHKRFFTSRTVYCMSNVGCWYGDCEYSMPFTTRIRLPLRNAFCCFIPIFYPGTLCTSHRSALERLLD